jgi:apolipoprotein D and lipocalin family protein
MRSLPILIAASLLAIQAPMAARGGAKPPSKPIAASFYTGKWYEIARTPNSGQRDCQAPTTEFTGKGANGFSVHQICRKGSASGAAKTFEHHRHDRRRHPERQVQDELPGRAEEAGILGARPRRRPVLGDHGHAGRQLCLAAVAQAGDGPAAKAQALDRVKALGYAKLEYPQQPPA